jgi:inorganic triphosphatase YgiF
MDQSEASLVALTRFALHLLAHIEGLETLLVQKEVATKQEIREAIAKAQGQLDHFAQGIPRPGTTDFESALTRLLESLQGRRLADRLR